MLPILTEYPVIYHSPRWPVSTLRLYRGIKYFRDGAVKREGGHWLSGGSGSQCTWHAALVSEPKAVGYVGVTWALGKEKGDELPLVMCPLVLR